MAINDKLTVEFDKNERAYMKITNQIINPIRPGFFPDPSIVRVNDDYYMVNSSFIYFPCIPISHSKDLVHWKIIGHAIADPAYIDLSPFEAGRGFWAPDISYSNGKYYIVATLRGNEDMEYTHRQMVVWSDKPEGPYSKPVYIYEKGIDPSLFHDDDGRHYMLFNTSVKIIPLSDDCLSQAGPVRILHEGWSKIKTEGPHLLKKNGWYYLIMAEGGTGDGHTITVARSRSLNEPFENCPHNPLLTQTDSSAVLQRTGHGKFFVGPDGEWYTVYLCGRKRGGRYTLLGRETSLAKVTWTEDGWPVINGGNGPLETISVNYDINIVEQTPYVIDFASPALPEDLIKPNVNIACETLLTRQTAIDCTTRLELATPLINEQEAGLIFFYDIYSYVKFGCRKRNEELNVFISKMNISESEKEQLVTEIHIPLPQSELSLEIETLGLKKEFILKCDDYQSKFAVLNDCSFLTDEGISHGKRFTGPVVGVFFDESGYSLLKKFTLQNK